MLGDGLPEYVFVRGGVAALQLVAPASILYCAIAAYTRTFPISPWLASLAVAETSFYLFIYLPRTRRLQTAPGFLPVRLTKAQRQKLFEKCCIDASRLSRMEPGHQPYPEGWFLPAGKDISRLDVRNWLLWKFFTVDGETEDIEEWREELEGYVSIIEEEMGKKLGERKADSAKGMRVTSDPVKIMHRPLVWYLFIGVMNAFISVYLARLGFKHYSSQRYFETFPPRPLLSFLSNPSCLPDDILLPYWYRPHKSPDKLPILFIHGIGGLQWYVSFISAVVAQEPDVGIVIVELLPLTGHMTAKSLPPRHALLTALNDLLDSLNMPRVVFASHSFGTAIAAQMIRPPRSPRFDSPSVEHPAHDPRAHQAHQALQRKISSLLLLDPIPLLPHLPTLTYSFLYRRPRRTMEWLVWYFMSTDPDIAHTLGRVFFMEECMLWTDDIRRFMRGHSFGNSDAVLPGSVALEQWNFADPAKGSSAVDEPKNIVIVLAGSDSIVAGESTRRYLTEEALPAPYWRHAGWAWSPDPLESGSGKAQVVRDASDSCQRRKRTGRSSSEGVSHKGGDLEVLFYPKLEHCGVFFMPEARRAMLDALHRFVRNR